MFRRCLGNPLVPATTGVSSRLCSSAPTRQRKKPVRVKVSDDSGPSLADSFRESSTPTATAVVDDDLPIGPAIISAWHEELNAPPPVEPSTKVSPPPPKKVVLPDAKLALSCSKLSALSSADLDALWDVVPSAAPAVAPRQQPPTTTDAGLAIEISEAVDNDEEDDTDAVDAYIESFKTMRMRKKVNQERAAFMAEKRSQVPVHRRKKIEKTEYTPSEMKVLTFAEAEATRAEWRMKREQDALKQPSSEEPFVAAERRRYPPAEATPRKPREIELPSYLSAWSGDQSGSTDDLWQGDSEARETPQVSPLAEAFTSTDVPLADRRESRKEHNLGRQDKPPQSLAELQNGHIVASKSKRRGLGHEWDGVKEEEYAAKKAVWDRYSASSEEGWEMERNAKFNEQLKSKKPPRHQKTATDWDELSPPERARSDHTLDRQGPIILPKDPDLVPELKPGESNRLGWAIVDDEKRARRVEEEIDIFGFGGSGWVSAKKKQLSLRKNHNKIIKKVKLPDAPIDRPGWTVGKMDGSKRDIERIKMRQEALEELGGLDASEALGLLKRYEGDA